MPIGCSTMKPSSVWFTKRWGGDIRKAAAAAVWRTGSDEVLEREVRANLVYRDFTRVGGGKMPDAKTIGRWGLAVGPETVKQVHERLVQMAKAEGIATGRRMRVDT